MVDGLGESFNAAPYVGRYDELIRLHVVPAIGRIRLEKLAPQDVQSLINQKLAQGSLRKPSGTFEAS
jgi:hypothetical protein